MSDVAVWTDRHARALLATATAALAIAVVFASLRYLDPPPPVWMPGLTYPRIQQAAGIIDLLRRLDPALRPAALRAFDGLQLGAEIDSAPPPAGAGLRRAPRIEDKLREFAAPGLEGLETYIDARYPSRSIDTEGWPARVVWSMGDGHVLVLTFREHSPPSRAFPAIPRPVLIGLAGVGIAVLALLLARRERATLDNVVRAAERFDGRAAPAIADAAGGPEVRRLASAVQAMQQRVALLLQERSFLIGAISHDLKTYLTRLRLRAEALPDEALRDKMAGDLESMTDLIDTSLAFARGTTVTQHIGLVDLADLVAIEAAERAALDQHVTAAIIEEDAQVLGDALALRRVLGNLVDNALKFGRGKVILALEDAGTTYRVLVDDDGPGIGEAERAAIFSPFYRIEGSRNRRTGGSGLGLAIARQIVQSHGGTILVDDSPLGGARFTTVLPKQSAEPYPAAVGF